MKQYKISGMSCAACSARIGKTVSGLEGVTGCNVNLLTNSMEVDGDVSPASVISAVTSLGYGASLAEKTDAFSFADTESPKLIKRLCASVFFLLLLMYFSMAEMLSLPLPAFLAEKPLYNGILQAFLAFVVIIINGKFFKSGFSSLISLSPNMDTLVSMGSLAAFLYSFCLLVFTPYSGEGLYFDSSAMILTLITVGKLLEAKSKGKTTNAIKSLIDLSPKSATVISDGEEKIIPAKELKIGDIFILKSGDSIPCDGKILSGNGSFDESALTGESMPQDKSDGDLIYGGCIISSGYVKASATQVGELTALSKIIETVSRAAASKAPAQKIADRVSAFFVPAVIGIALLTTAAWLLSGQSVGYSLARGISVLVISCPCSLGLATPVAVMVASGVGAKNGILYKTASSLENCGKATVCILDKTGTLTQGKPRVCDVIPAKGCSEDFILSVAASLEKLSEHPLATAVTSYGTEKAVELFPVSDYNAYFGKGISGHINSKKYYAGNALFTDAEKSPLFYISQRLSRDGKTSVFIKCDSEIIGIIAIKDSLKEDSAETVNELKKMGILPVMLSGDNIITAQAIAKEAGINTVYAQVLPGEKENIVRSYMEKARVIMVGDGINDSPALTRADIGIAMGSGVDIAVESADIVLLSPRLKQLTAAIRLSRIALRDIKQNLFWAFIYNSLGIPLAAGVFIPFFGLELSPVIGAAAMSLSSFCVVMNALRINLANIYDSRHDKCAKHISEYNIITNMKGNNEMKITLNVEGMMCPHCSGRVKNALEKIEGVTLAEVSHETGNAVVTLAEDVPADTLISAIENEGYRAALAK